MEAPENKLRHYSAGFRRHPGYQDAMARLFDLPMTCNACDRIIYDDENHAEEYRTNGGYCPECAAEAEEAAV